ncbi:MAG: hypothetical protein ACREQM_07555 [Candidatus Dormibacteraceae bacterium]
MSGSLEARCRALLFTYPSEYRAYRGDEIVDTMLALALPGQRWPSALEAAGLLLGGLRARARLSRRDGIGACLGDSMRVGCALWLALAAGGSLAAAVASSSVADQAFPFVVLAAAIALLGGRRWLGTPLILLAAFLQAWIIFTPSQILPGGPPSGLHFEGFQPNAAIGYLIPYAAGIAALLVKPRSRRGHRSWAGLASLLALSTAIGVPEVFGAWTIVGLAFNALDLATVAVVVIGMLVGDVRYGLSLAVIFLFACVLRASLAPAFALYVPGLASGAIWFGACATVAAATAGFGSARARVV